MTNSIFVIFPYRAEGTWVFDDARVGLVREPFVSGVPEILDLLVKNIPEASEGFKLLFSAAPFPGCTSKFVWRKAELGGNWYFSEQHGREGWLCPALFKYFSSAPRELYVKAEPKQR